MLWRSSRNKKKMFSSVQIHVLATLKWEMKEIGFEVHIFRYILALKKFRTSSVCLELTVDRLHT